MKIILQHILLLSLAISLFSSCKKYDQGSWVKDSEKNLFGVKRNMSAKEWKLNLYEVNGVDSTNLISGANTIPDFFDHFVTFKVYDTRYSDFDASSFLYNYTGSIEEKYKTLAIGLANSDEAFQTDLQCKTKYGTSFCERNIFNPEHNKGMLWNIKKLTSNELIITVSLTNSYKIILKSN